MKLVVLASATLSQQKPQAERSRSQSQNVTEAKYSSANSSRRLSVAEARNKLKQVKEKNEQHL